MVAGNSDGVRASTTLHKADALTHPFPDAGWAAVFLVDDHLLTLSTVAMGVERVEDTIGGFLKALAEGVVTAFVVVIAHFRRWVDGGFDFDFSVFYFFARVGAATLVLNVVRWMDASAVVAFGDVDLFLSAGDFDVDLGLGGALVAGFTVAGREMVSA